MRRKLPRFLRDEQVVELRTVLDQQLKSPDTTMLRNALMTCLMLDCGLRCSEVTSLPLLAVDWQRRMLYIVGKFGKERMVGYPGYLHDYMVYYHQVTYGYYNARKFFFRTNTGGKVGNRYVRRMVKRLGSLAGLDNVHPHMLRHTFATQYYDETRNIVWLGKVLGHAGVESTQVYMHCCEDDAINHMKARR